MYYKLRQWVLKVLNLLNLRSQVIEAYFKIKDSAPWNRGAHKKKLAFYSQFLKPGDLCFDIGANLGGYTRTFLQVGARTVTVEPQKDCLQYLNETFRNNSLVTVLGQAVGDKKGLMEMAICQERDSLSTLSEKWRTAGRHASDFTWKGTEKVSVTTLDALIEEHGLPQFCKVDVEGFEKEVLQGLSQKIPYLSFEFTREFFDDAETCLRLLEKLGPLKVNCVLGDNFKFFFPDWVTPEALTQTLDVIENPELWGDIYTSFKN